MKPDTELLAALRTFLQKAGAKTQNPIVLQPPVPGFDTPEQIDRAVAVAEAKWFLDRVVRAKGEGGPKWTFELSTRGAEAFEIG